jgi:ATP synthase protein I
MLANDARVLIRSAVATAVAGLILIAIGTVVDGGKGALGAVLAVMLVTVFFTISVVAVSLAGRWWGPAAMTAAALATFLVKVVAVLAIVAAFRDTTAFNTNFFGITAIACILVWSAGQVATLARRRILYVDPASTPKARPAGAPRGAGEQ